MNPQRSHLLTGASVPESAANQPRAAEPTEHHVFEEHLTPEMLRGPQQPIWEDPEQVRLAREFLATCPPLVRPADVDELHGRLSAAARGELDGRTDLFVHGDHPFAVVDLLLTNFHLPRSSLLVLIDALVGPRWRRLYATALAEGYRFLSFGDAMLLRRGRGD